MTHLPIVAALATAVTLTVTATPTATPDASTPVGAPSATTPITRQSAGESGVVVFTRRNVDESTGVTLPPQSAKDLEAGGNVVLKTILGLVCVFALAWLAAHPVVVRWQHAIGLTHIVGAGLPFVLLGLILRHGVGVLDDRVLHELTPLFEFGLGWLGFLVGFRFNINYMERLPRGMPLVIALQTSLPFVAVFVVCGSIMMAYADTAYTNVIRDAVVLAAASAMTATRSLTHHSFAGFQRTDRDIVTLTEQLDEIAAVVVLLFLTAYDRPEGDQFTWQLPGTAWIFIALGMGVALGLLIHIMLQQRATGSEFLAITLGSVAFTAGMADYLWLSPIVVCFIAGSIVANLPLAQGKERLWAILAQVEWPLYLVFLTCVGALWDITDWRGWLLVPAFVTARMIGKWLSIAALTRVSLDHRYDGLLAGRTVFARLSGLSIAMVVGWNSLYGGASARWIVTAVVGGAVVLEFNAQVWDRMVARFGFLATIGSGRDGAAPHDEGGAP